MGSTYAYFAISDSNNTITGDAASVNINLDVSRIYPKANADSTGVLVPQLSTSNSPTSPLANALKSGCIDGNKNEVCHVYKINIKNEGGTVNEVVNGNISFFGNPSLTTDIATVMPNLKWRLVDTVNETTPTNSVLGTNTDNTALSEGENFVTDLTISNNQSFTYYIIVWINETNTDQIIDEGNSFYGVIDIDASNGSGVTAVFGNTKTAIDDTKYTVTFDPNGGTVSTTSKQVTIGQKYGSLPTPTREGYTFKGWNGKNILNIEKSKISGIRTKTEFNAWASIAFDNKWIINYLQADKSYTINFDAECTFIPDFDSQYSPHFGFMLYSEKTGYNLSILYCNKYLVMGEKIHCSQSFTTSSELHNSTANYNILAYTNRYLKNDVGVYSKIILSNIQLEEGSTATDYEPYYITTNTKVVQAKNHTLKAIWEKNKEAVFLSGTEFNIKIKKLAGDTNATHETDNTSINSIEKATGLPSSWIVNNTINVPSENNIVSTSNSEYPIYAWYNNGVIYYYTEAKDTYMNSNAWSMFRSLVNLTHIDLDKINTTRTTNMQSMFYNCRNLDNLDLSSFNTSNVTTMLSMFNGCQNLKSLNISSFNTSNVTTMYGMFFNNKKITSLDLTNFDTKNVTNMDSMFSACSSLNSVNLSSFNTNKVTSMAHTFGDCNQLNNLDLSSFDMSNVTNTTSILSNTSSLQRLKTPKVYPVSQTINLYKTFYDSSNNSYTSLGSGSPTSTWLNTR